MHPSGNQDMAKALGSTEQAFGETLAAADGLVMVDFWAEWCGPCQAIAPVLEKIADGSDGRVTLMKVNVDENHSLAARYAIRSIPTILFVKDGMVVERVVGAVPRAVLEEIVNAHASWRCLRRSSPSSSWRTARARHLPSRASSASR